MLQASCDPVSEREKESESGQMEQALKHRIRRVLDPLAFERDFVWVVDSALEMDSQEMGTFIYIYAGGGYIYEFKVCPPERTALEEDLRRFVEGLPE